MNDTNKNLSPVSHNAIAFGRDLFTATIIIRKYISVVSINVKLFKEKTTLNFRSTSVCKNCNDRKKKKTPPIIKKLHLFDSDTVLQRQIMNLVQYIRL